MKNRILLITIVNLFGVLYSFAQTNAKKRDTVRTEVIKVTTKYNPKIADANKIKKQPEINLLGRNLKKKLNYNLFSAPVASTFIPQSGVAKPLDVGKRERVYQNFIALGFGNYSTPYLEASINSEISRNGEFGFNTKYLAALDNIENTLLDSNFSNFSASAFYKQEERFFDWKIGLDSEINEYNWYGIPFIFFTDSVINEINASQNYNFFRATGEIAVLDGFFSSGKLSIANFSDNFNSNEILLDVDLGFRLPTDFLNSGLNDLNIAVGLEYLNGNFLNNYEGNSEIDYSIFTASVHPFFEDTFGNWFIHLGVKAFASLDTENDKNNFFVYPDVQIETAIIQDNLNFFIGATGALTTNTFKSFTDMNPFVSPTLNITQTSESYNAFTGIKGLINSKLGYTLSVNYKNEENKALFVSNNSKSNGTTSSFNGKPILGYEYGNSFSVIYDDVKTLSFFGEVNYEISRELNVGANLQIDDFSTTKLAEAWNLPTLRTGAFGKFRTKKWYATANLFYVNTRNDVAFSNIFPSNANGSTEIDAFVDLNLNGGYHFSDKFSAFVKLNNVLNSDYQQFIDFTVQGFQVLGGFTYKFDF